MHPAYPPVEVLATWPQPNYIDPTTRGPGIIITSAILGTLTLVVVVARMYARFHLLKSVGVDDCLILLAMPLLIALLVVIGLLTSSYQFDRHAWDSLPALGVIQSKLSWMTEWIYVVLAGVVKLSVLAFFRRLTVDSISRTFKILIWISIAAVVGFMVAFTFALYFSCSTLDAYWLSQSPTWSASHKYTCIEFGPVLLAATIVSLVQDVVTAVLPMSLFWHLRIDIRQKLALGAIFAVGLFACSADGVRLYYLHILLYESYDATWHAWDIYLWTVVISTMGIICASAPSLRVYFIHNRASSKGSEMEGSMGSYGNNGILTSEKDVTSGAESKGTLRYKASESSSNPESYKSMHARLRADSADEGGLSELQQQLKLEREFRV